MKAIDKPRFVKEARDLFSSLNIEIKTCQAPEDARWFSLANVVYTFMQSIKDEKC